MTADLPALRTLSITANPYITENSEMSEATSNKPIHVLRRRGIKVSIFENRSSDMIFYKFTIQKIYRDEGGAWKTTTSYARDDGLVISKLTDQAWDWISEREDHGKQSTTQGESRSWSESVGYSTTETRIEGHQIGEGETR